MTEQTNQAQAEKSTKATKPKHRIKTGSAIIVVANGDTHLTVNGMQQHPAIILQEFQNSDHMINATVFVDDTSAPARVMRSIRHLTAKSEGQAYWAFPDEL